MLRIEGRKSVGLVLGAGATKGLAHVGVLQALQDNDIPVDIIVGSSAGALVGAIYAFDPTVLEKLAMNLNVKEIFSRRWWRPSGWIKAFHSGGWWVSSDLIKYLRGIFGDVTPQQLRPALGIVVTHLRSGAEVIYYSAKPSPGWDLSTFVAASCAAPPLIAPVKIDTDYYVDGAVSSPVPVPAMKTLATPDITIAVDLSENFYHSVPLFVVPVALAALDHLYTSLAMEDCERADVVIRPKVGWMSSWGDLDNKTRENAIKAGRDAALAALPRIKNLLEIEEKNGHV